MSDPAVEAIKALRPKPKKAKRVCPCRKATDAEVDADPTLAALRAAHQSPIIREFLARNGYRDPCD